MILQVVSFSVTGQGLGMCVHTDEHTHAHARAHTNVSAHIYTHVCTPAGTFSVEHSVSSMTTKTHLLAFGVLN